MSTSTVCISIGRNIGNDPMPETHWRQFKTDTLTALARAGAIPLAAAEGAGMFSNKPEDTALFLALVPGLYIEGLRYRMSLIAAEYSQKAIGFTEAPSDTTLVYARTETETN